MSDTWMAADYLNLLKKYPPNNSINKIFFQINHIMKKHIFFFYILLISSLSGFAFSTFKKKFIMPVEKIVTQAIFYHNESQKQKAKYYISKLVEQKIYDKRIVTEVTPFTKFYKAESYHQNYYKNNPNQNYCRYVIQPELEKFKKIFKNKLKS